MLKVEVEKACKVKLCSPITYFLRLHSLIVKLYRMGDKVMPLALCYTFDTALGATSVLSIQPCRPVRLQLPWSCYAP